MGSLRVVKADLHVHTCLSPCATLDMTPMKIVGEACRRNLSIIAVTDHNSAENASAVIEAAKHTALTVIPGMEVTTAEEIHLVGLFNDIDFALSMQTLVYDRLLPGENDEDLFGIQVVANAMDEVESVNNRLLIGATGLTLEETVAAIHQRGGLAIAAHIDRAAFSIVSQLGFIPPELDLDAVEVSRHLPVAEARTRFSEYRSLPFITTSDAHDLGEIAMSPTCFRVLKSDLSELKMALRGQADRAVLHDCK